LDPIDEITNHIQFDKYLGAPEILSTQLQISQVDSSTVGRIWFRRRTPVRNDDTR